MVKTYINSENSHGFDFEILTQAGGNPYYHKHRVTRTYPVPQEPDFPDVYPFWPAA